MLDLAQRAISHWPIAATSITLAAHRENAVFRVESKEQGTFALRLHRPDYRSTPELISELQFMAALQANGLCVPGPVESKAGRTIEIIDNTQVSLLTWVSGRPLGQTGQPLQLQNRSAFFHRFGKLMARLHTIADHWQRPSTFTRQSWNRAGLMGENPQWGRFWNNPALNDNQRKILIAARQKIDHILAHNTWDEGLIHADLVSENILVDGDNIVIIDFDDSGSGYRLQDFSTALVKHQQEPDYLQLKSALVAGYRETRAIDEANIDLFLLIRHLSYVGWIVPRMTGEAGKARSAFFISDAVKRAEQWLS